MFQMNHVQGPTSCLSFWPLQLPERAGVCPRRFKGRKPRYLHGCTQPWTVGFMTQILTLSHRNDHGRMADLDT